MRARNEHRGQDLGLQSISAHACNTLHSSHSVAFQVPARKSMSQQLRPLSLSHVFPPRHVFRTALQQTQRTRWMQAMYKEQDPGMRDRADKNSQLKFECVRTVVESIDYDHSYATSATSKLICNKNACRDK
jgi:hypothetical protein